MHVSITRETRRSWIMSLFGKYDFPELGVKRKIRNSWKPYLSSSGFMYDFLWEVVKRRGKIVDYLVNRQKKKKKLLTHMFN